MVFGMREKGFILGLEKVKIVDEMAATRSYLIHVSNFVHKHFLLIKRKLKGNRMSETQKLKKKKNLDSIKRIVWSLGKKIK